MNILDRLGQEKLNNQGSLMKIIEYIDSSNIIVEFQDKHRAKVNTQYCNFQSGSVKNPYCPSVYGIGIIGNKYPVSEDCKHTKEYKTWDNMLKRCFSRKLKNEQPTYKDVSCCNEWLLFDNFYEWIHSQDNFWQWKSSDRYALEKDILVKNNKIYSSETCCLVPPNVNCLFLKRKANRGELPIGVQKSGVFFLATCHNPFTNKSERLGIYQTVEETFQAYKRYKEYLIKKVAEIEFSKGNITKKCYNAMMNYQVEIDD